MPIYGKLYSLRWPEIQPIIIIVSSSSRSSSTTTTSTSSSSNSSNTQVLGLLDRLSKTKTRVIT